MSGVSRQSLALRSPLYAFLGVAVTAMGMVVLRKVPGPFGGFFAAVTLAVGVLFTVAGAIGTRVVVDERRRAVELWSLLATLRVVPPVILRRADVQHVAVSASSSSDGDGDLWSVVVVTSDGKRHGVGVGASSAKAARESEAQMVAAFLGVPARLD